MLGWVSAGLNAGASSYDTCAMAVAGPARAQSATINIGLGFRCSERWRVQLRHWRDGRSWARQGSERCDQRWAGFPLL